MTTKQFLHDWRLKLQSLLTTITRQWQSAGRKPEETPTGRRKTPFKVTNSPSFWTTFGYLTTSCINFWIKEGSVLLKLDLTEWCRWLRRMWVIPLRDGKGLDTTLSQQGKISQATGIWRSITDTLLITRLAPTPPLQPHSTISPAHSPLSRALATLKRDDKTTG